MASIQAGVQQLARRILTHHSHTNLTVSLHEQTRVQHQKVARCKAGKYQAAMLGATACGAQRALDLGAVVPLPGRPIAAWGRRTESALIKRSLLSRGRQSESLRLCRHLQWTQLECETASNDTGAALRHYHLGSVGGMQCTSTLQNLTAVRYDTPPRVQRHVGPCTSPLHLTSRSASK